MAAYNFKLYHKPGEQHANPYFLSRHLAYDKGGHDNENTMLLQEYHCRGMMVGLETIGEGYQQWVCQGVGLAKKVKGWRKLPGGSS
jgi:hypothetical protein